MTEMERAALATMVYEAIRFADLMAGEGICPTDDADAKDPADILSDYVTAIGGDSWEGLAAAAREMILNGLTVTDDMTERAKRCTYGNPDCPKCNPLPNG